MKSLLTHFFLIICSFSFSQEIEVKEEMIGKFEKEFFSQEYFEKNFQEFDLNKVIYFPDQYRASLHIQNQFDSQNYILSWLDRFSETQYQSPKLVKNVGLKSDQFLFEIIIHFVKKEEKLFVYVPDSSWRFVLLQKLNDDKIIELNVELVYYDNGNLKSNTHTYIF